MSYPLNLPFHNCSLLPPTATPSTTALFSRALLHIFSFHHEEAVYTLTSPDDIAILPTDLETTLLKTFLLIHCHSPNYNWDADSGFHIIASQNEPTPPDPYKYPSASYVQHLLATLPPLAVSSSSCVSSETQLSTLLRAMITANTSLHSTPPSYSAACTLFATLHTANPANSDLAFFYITSLLLLHPWQFFKFPTGISNFPTITKELDAVFASLLPTPHLGLNHMYVHYIEMSSTPSLALAACAVLATATDLPHLLHMGSHITLQTGDYINVVKSNLKAIESDRKYALHFKDTSTKSNGFFVGYMAHDFHMAVYGACLGGFKKVAVDVVEELLTLLVPVDRLIENEHMLVGQEMFLGLRLGVYLRFGMWEAVLKETEETVSEKLQVFECARAIMRVTALANLNRVEEGRVVMGSVGAMLPIIQSMTRFQHNNTAFDILTVEAARAAAELLFFEGKLAECWGMFDAAVKGDDGLRYDEPWGVLVPTRHSYAALLLDGGGEKGRMKAVELYKEDLKRNPRNVWSAAGLVRAGADEQGEWGRVIEEQRKGEFSDVEVTTSCACSRGVLKS